MPKRLGIVCVVAALVAILVGPVGARAGTPRERAATGTVVLRAGDIITVAATGEKGASGVVTWQANSNAPVVTIPLSCAVIVWQFQPADPAQPTSGDYSSLTGLKAWARAATARSTTSGSAT